MPGHSAQSKKKNKKIKNKKIINKKQTIKNKSYGLYMT